MTQESIDELLNRTGRTGSEFEGALFHLLWVNYQGNPSNIVLTGGNISRFKNYARNLIRPYHTDEYKTQLIALFDEKEKIEQRIESRAIEYWGSFAAFLIPGLHVPAGAWIAKVHWDWYQDSKKIGQLNKKISEINGNIRKAEILLRMTVNYQSMTDYIR